MRKTTRIVGAVLAGLAVTGGTITGIAATNGTTSSSGTSSTATVPAHPDGRGAFGHGGPSVHEVSVQLNTAGTDLITVTSDQGTVKSVSGGTLTIHEGTTKGRLQGRRDHGRLIRDDHARRQEGGPLRPQGR